MEKIKVVVRASDTLVTELPEPDPEVLENMRQLATKIPALAWLYPSPQIQRLVRAAAEAERRVLEDEKFREMLAQHGLTEDSSRSDILAAMRAEYLAAHSRLQRLFDLTLEGES